MKPFLFLLIGLLIINNVQGDYSINTFLNYLHETGYFEILVQVKFHFGPDVSIYVCLEFVNSNFCEEVIRVYIPNSHLRALEEDNLVEKQLEKRQLAESQYLNIEELYPFLYQDRYLKILLKFYEEEEIKKKIRKIIEKFSNPKANSYY